MMTFEGFTEDDARRTIMQAMRLLAILTVIALPLVWWKGGAASAVLFLVGAAISGSGLWEWLRLMTALFARMNAGGDARPMTGVLLGFFLRIGLSAAVLYASLKYLDGSVYALALGLGLGIFALTVEALKLAKAWTT